MTISTEIFQLDATAQAAMVKKSEIKPIELVEAAIGRIEKVNPELNAVITLLYDSARKAAQATLPDGPFTGVPYLMKDNNSAVAGAPTSLGTALLKGFIPTHDSELTKRLKKAGLIILGKTNTPEFGLLPTTEPRRWGPTCNPWDPKKTTGGSSGGSAAAVASGMVPMAHASDGGGSIRIPASCCGVFGMKPTRARNPLGPNFGDLISGLVCEHAVTRSVRDSAALLDATSGPDVGDPYWAPPPKRPFADEVNVEPGKLKIAFTVDSMMGILPHEECVKTTNVTAALCSDLGHEIVEAGPTLSQDKEVYEDAFTILWLSSCASTVEAISRTGGFPPDPAYFEPLTWALYEKGREFKASEYLTALETLQRMSREICRFFNDYDVLLTPALAEPPVNLGTFDAPLDNPMAAWDRVVKFAPYTALFNATGQPAMSIPLYWSEGGLPIGSHFVGKFGDEATLFRLAAQLEAARPWMDRRPPISAI